MKILIFGGTGFVGSDFFREVLEQAETLGIQEVTVVSRKKSTATRLFSDSAVNFGAIAGKKVKLKALEWDVVNDVPQTFSHEVNEATHIFYSVQFPGHPVEDEGKGLTYARYDLGGLKNILSVADKQKPKRFLYISGAGVGQGRNEPWFVAKDQAEALLRKHSSESGGSFLSLRPSLIYGERDISLNRFLNIARKTHIVPLLGDGSTKIYPIWVRSLSQVLVQFGLTESLSGCFDVPGPREISFKDLMKTLLSVRNVKAALIPSPLWLCKASGSFLGRLPGQILNANAVTFLTTSVPMHPAEFLKDALVTLEPPERAFTKYSS